MLNTIRAFTVFAVGALVIGVGLKSYAQTPDKTTDLGKWDSAWELFDPNDRFLTEITVKNGKIEFSRSTGRAVPRF